MRAKELYEYEFDFKEVALPFMHAVVLGGPNPNICIKLVEPDESKTNHPNGQFDITFKPLQNLSLLERNDTCNVALKAISCGTFKRNLQPVVKYIFQILTLFCYTCITLYIPPFSFLILSME